jgi:hypothetical protein
MKLMAQALAKGDIIRFRGRDCEVLEKVISFDETRLRLSFIGFNGMAAQEQVWLGSHDEITIIKIKGAVPWEDQ